MAPESETYPIVRISWSADPATKAPQSAEPANAERGEDLLSSSTVQPARAANIGIYTPSGKLDDRSRLAQKLREAEEKKSNNRPGGSAIPGR